MTAALEAALSLPEDSICIVSDSAYVVNCFKDRWYEGWHKRAIAGVWRNSQKQAVANQDLWEPLIDVVLHRGITFRKVRGHSGDPMNELVDQLAVEAKFSRSAA